MIEQFNSFLEFSNEYDKTLEEALIVLNKKAYPKFGNIVILAGGAGSGKGFVVENLLGMDGKILDVDKLKKLVQKSTDFAARIKKETGEDIAHFDLKVPENVSKLHAIIADNYGTPKKVEDVLFNSIMASDPERKPNIIFDVTLKDMKKLRKISEYVSALGYEKTNVHIVWVMNDVDVAIEQNATRARRVPEKILLSTHEGAALTMKEILDDSTTARQYADGDIWIVFNKAKVDSKYEKSDIPQRPDLKAKKKPKAHFISKAFYVRAKAAGKVASSVSELDSDVVAKIRQYIPKDVEF